MAQTNYFEAYGGTAPENYERYFVPTIGRPLASSVLNAAQIQPGDRVLDVACGTGVLTRLAADKVGAEGKVAGLDLNPGMVEAARSAANANGSIEWHVSGAESMPLPDDSFDVVLCQLGLQFMQDKASALAEMHRVLAPGGRLVIGVAGPIPQPFVVFDEALSKHISPEVGPFVRMVFSLHKREELQALVGAAGFADIAIRAEDRTLSLPSPPEFLWQYVHSTPLVQPVSQVDAERRAALEQDVVAGWQEFVEDQTLRFTVPMVIVTASK